MKRVMVRQGQLLLLVWDECPSCEGMTKAPDTFGCWDCRNGGRLQHWAPPGPWLLEHLKRIWWGLEWLWEGIVDGVRNFRI
jgi:hypothetical protein